MIPYFHRFLKEFPTLADLAQATEHHVLRLWEGLGYYRRARDLHRAARIVVAEHGGKLPNDPMLIRKLPGLGRYTCNAILSQAFGRGLPIVEANSQRVLSRLFGCRDDLKSTSGQRWLWSTAEALVPSRDPGAFNQGLMELGALVCKPSEPRCGDCPLASPCVARRLGLQAEIPLRPISTPISAVRELAIVPRRGKKVLLVQRPDTGRWAGLWEFPHGEILAGESEETVALRLARDLLGLDVRLGPEILQIRHGVTRFAITMVCREATWRKGRFRSGLYVDHRWLEPRHVSQFPVSSPQRKLASAILRPDAK